MEDKLVTVADFADHIAANAAKLQLKADGIEAVVVGENLMGAYPTYGTMRIEVQVMAEDVAKAKAVLESVAGDYAEDEQGAE